MPKSLALFRTELRAAIEYRSLIQGLTTNPAAIEELGLSRERDPHPSIPDDPLSLEVKAVLEDASEAVKYAAQGLAAELKRQGYPTLDIGAVSTDSSTDENIDKVTQEMANELRRRVRKTRGANVKVFTPEGR